MVFEKAKRLEEAFFLCEVLLGAFYGRGRLIPIIVEGGGDKCPFARFFPFGKVISIAQVPICGVLVAPVQGYFKALPLSKQTVSLKWLQYTHSV